MSTQEGIVGQDLEMTSLMTSGVAALLFAVTFLIGGRVHPLQSLVRDRRTYISFGAGMTAAFVFVHLLPELHGAREAFAESESLSSARRYEGMAIYFLALVGFLVFYGLDYLRQQLHESDAGHESAEAEEGGAAFRIHVGGFAAYVGLMSYLLVHNLEGEISQMAAYAVAIAVHFLGIDHALREEHGAAYQRIGRFVLAGMCLLGWGVGQLIALPEYAIALLVAFVSGSIIMNSLISELPAEKDGRFLPFVVGGLLYGLILLPLG